MAMTRLSLCNSCGCKSRQAKWNNFLPGLGDTAAIVFDPIQSFICPNDSGESSMSNMLKPDLKAVVWLAVGFLVIPRVMAMVKK
jgi:hypothetical protein